MFLYRVLGGLCQAVAMDGTAVGPLNKPLLDLTNLCSIFIDFLMISMYVYCYEIQDERYIVWWMMNDEYKKIGRMSHTLDAWRGRANGMHRRCWGVHVASLGS